MRRKIAARSIESWLVVALCLIVADVLIWWIAPTLPWWVWTPIVLVTLVLVPRAFEDSE